MRGRNRGKGPNPLSRSYESNGPDVKVRGNASHIAEKYVQLARDAQSSGDPILAESYLQHAEHYFRLVAAAQQQFGGPQGYEGSDEGDDDDMEFDGRLPSMPQSPYAGGYPQGGPQGDEQPAFAPMRNERPDNGERPQPEGGFRQERFQGDRNNQNRFRDNRFQGDRPPREDRFQGERPPREDRFQGDRPPREDRFQGERPPREDRFQGERPPREDRFQGDRPPREDRFQGDRPPRDNRFQGDRPPRENRFEGERPVREDRGEGMPPAAPTQGRESEGERPQFQPRRNRGERFGERPPYQERGERPAPVIGLDQPQPEISDDRALSMLPSFITGAPAAPAPVAPAPIIAAPPVPETPAAEAAPVAAPEGEGEARFPLRARRKRTPKAADTEPAAE
jgi:hypothetical protein